MISGGIVMGIEFLSGAVSDQMSDTALQFGVGGDGDAGDNNCGNDGGAGQGSGNTC